MFAHFVGDFLAQTTYMALGKSKKWPPLLLHVFVYSAILAIITFPFWGNTLYWICFITANFSLHLLVDSITAPISAKLWESDLKRGFFCMIGFDQFLHFVCLNATLTLLN